MKTRNLAMALLPVICIAGCSDDGDPVAPVGGRGNIMIVVKPSYVNASWQLSGPQGFSLSDQGDTTLVNMDTGRYTLTWGVTQDWIAPAAETNTLVVGGTLVFTGAYNITRTCHEWRRDIGFRDITPTDEQRRILGPEATGNWCPPEERSQGQLPTVPLLFPAYPNPSIGKVFVYFAISSVSHVTLRIYDDNCRIVRTLVKMHMSPGSYEATWDHRDNHGVLVENGIYACEIVVGNFVCLGNIEVRRAP